MRTIRITLDDELAATFDQVVKQLKTTRSAFMCKALRNAIKQVTINEFEKKHKKGYGLRPVDKVEFSIWEPEQKWGDSFYKRKNSVNFAMQSTLH